MLLDASTNNTDMSKSMIHTVQLKPGLAMIDAGCRRAVGGVAWHKEFQKELDKRHLPRRRIGQKEYFQFGPGNPYLSAYRWAYPVGVAGCEQTVEISSVDADVPGCED